MRCSKAELRRRVNGDLGFRYEAEGLTSFAGLELVRQYFSKLGLSGQIRRHVGRWLPASDFGGVAMVLLVLTLIISGGRRVRHLGYLGLDPLVLRSCGLARMPSARTVGRWLGGLDTASVQGLRRLNEALTLEVIRTAKLRRLTLDIDGSVVSTGLKVEGARRGFNPHHRRVPSYYPITAYEAQTGQVMAVANRPGNVHDGKASVVFIEELIGRSGEHRVTEKSTDFAPSSARLPCLNFAWIAPFSAKTCSMCWIPPARWSTRSRCRCITGSG